LKGRKRPRFRGTGKKEKTVRRIRQEMAHQFMRNEKENIIFCKHCEGILFRNLPLLSYCEPAYYELFENFHNERLCPPESMRGQDDKENKTPLSPTRPSRLGSQSNANKASSVGSIVFPPIFGEKIE
jgi:hypothetical protein